MSPATNANDTNANETDATDDANDDANETDASNINAFPRGGSLQLPDPFLLLGGHGSQFDLHFLEYINNDDHKLTTCIGTPYGANKWQVGDSE
jgi:hypothetical protein